MNKYKLEIEVESDYDNINDILSYYNNVVSLDKFTKIVSCTKILTPKEELQSQINKLHINDPDGCVIDDEVCLKDDVLELLEQYTIKK